MKSTVQNFAVALFLGCIVAITGQACATEIPTERIHINHDGTLQSSAQGMSLHGIGTSHIATEDFMLSVRGQFRMLSSAKLTLHSRKLASARPLAKPVWVSLVALGDIHLQIKGRNGEPSTFHRARTAVYHVRDKRWVLDSEEIKRL
jgi:hypothetical protein